MKKYTVALGRMNDYKHEAPERTAYTVGKGIFDERVFTVFPTREFMINACKKGGIYAVVKDEVSPSMFIYPTYQVKKSTPESMHC